MASLNTRETAKKRVKNVKPMADTVAAASSTSAPASAAPSAAPSARPPVQVKGVNSTATASKKRGKHGIPTAHAIPNGVAANSVLADAAIKLAAARANHPDLSYDGVFIPHSFCRSHSHLFVLFGHTRVVMHDAFIFCCCQRC